MRRLRVYPRPLVTLGYAGLRKACAAAMVPLDDADGWALADEQVLLAVKAARNGSSLMEGVRDLHDMVGSGRLRLGSRHRTGAPGYSELLALASMLRSPVADGVAP